MVPSCCNVILLIILFASLLKAESTTHVAVTRIILFFANTPTPVKPHATIIFPSGCSASVLTSGPNIPRCKLGLKVVSSSHVLVNFARAFLVTPPTSVNVPPI